MEAFSLIKKADVHSEASKCEAKEEANQRTAATQEKFLMTSETFWKPWQHSRTRVKASLTWLWGLLGALGGFEWYCLAALGILTAFMSFLMDLSVAKLLRAHQWLYQQLQGHSVLQFLCWTLYPAALCALSTTFSHSICPQSAGSGLPEVRTVLSGLELPDYLSLSHLFAKHVGLTCTLAAGSIVFLGKVGPFVHLSTMVGAYLDRLCMSVCKERKFRAQNEILVAAAAVGVASCFGTPVSGVLFSVEVMCAHFAVHDYCRCFFSATVGALTFRLLAVWSREQETIQALFKTNFSTELPYYPVEILVFAILGLVCGAVTCLLLFCHRWSLRFIRTNPAISQLLATEKALYSGIVGFLLALITFPHGVGRLMAAKLTMKQLLTSFLDSRQWQSLSQNASALPQQGDPDNLWLEWCPSGTSVLLTLGFFVTMKLWMLVVATTLPQPYGLFMPVFVYGAAIGRLIGEGLAYMFPGGIYSGGDVSPINPGGYALAGAAAFSGAATHTLSPAILVLEVTGQSTHAAPTLLAVLLANAVARSHRQPSLYDAISLSKKLPHLPSLLRTQPELSTVRVDQVWCAEEVVLGGRGALSSVQTVLEKGAGFEEVHLALSTSSAAMFPVVDSHDSQVLLGLVHRSELEKFLCGQTQLEVPQQLGDVCTIQPVPVRLSTKATVQQAHNVMNVLNIEQVLVTDNRRVFGVITWAQMKKMIEHLAKGEIEQSNGQCD